MPREPGAPRSPEKSAPYSNRRISGRRAAKAQAASASQKAARLAMHAPTPQAPKPAPDAPHAPQIECAQGAAEASDKQNCAPSETSTIANISARSAPAPTRLISRTPLPKGTPFRTPGNQGNDPCAQQTHRQLPFVLHPPVSSAESARAANPPPCPKAGKSDSDQGKVRNERSANNPRKAAGQSQ